MSAARDGSFARLDVPTRADDTVDSRSNGRLARQFVATRAPLCSDSNDSRGRTRTGWVRGSALVRVGGDGRRDEGLLDRARADPAQQVVDRAGLVVGARGPPAAEGLLADDRAGRLVVDVEVAGGEPQRLGRLGDRGPVVARSPRRSARTARRGRPESSTVSKSAVVVDVQGQQRAEVLGAEHLVGRVGADHDRRAHEVPRRSRRPCRRRSPPATGRRVPGRSRPQLVERAPVDHRAQEVARSRRRRPSAAPRPRRPGRRAAVPTASAARTPATPPSTSAPGTRTPRGRARCAARRRRRWGGRARSPCRRSRRPAAGRSRRWRCWLPTCRHRCWKVADEPVKWMPASAGSASSTSETSRPSPVSRLITPGGSPASSSSRMREQRGQRLGGGGLPDHRVAHQRGRGGQVAGDRGEVERGDRVDEALERAVVHPVPRAGGCSIGWFSRICRPKATLNRQKSASSHAGVDLGLVAGLGLAEHRGGVEPVAPRPGQQVGGAQQHGGALVEGQRAPRRGGPQRGLDGALGVLAGGVGPGARARARGRAGRPRRTRAPPATCWRPSMVTVSSCCAAPSSASAACRLARSGEPGA